MANHNIEKKYHYIYKTTNLINEKYYVGMHSTNKLDDGYLGSGYKLRRSINKHGKENFKMEILEFFSDRSSLSDREKQLVNEELLKEPMCMNLVFGGQGGFISINGYKKGAKKMNEVLWSNPVWVEKKKKHSSECIKYLHSIGFFNNYSNPRFAYKSHTLEAKSKIGRANSIHQIGDKNSQFGTCWITNGIENKKIKKSSIITDGWKFGRILKNN